LKQIGQTFSSYTYTDITTGFFEKGQEKFGENSSNMIFKALDIEKDIETQGFQEHSYDLVVASLVLHATSDIERTLNNVRRLLKPGGYLLMLEITGDSPISIGFTVSGLPGWWLGGSDRRYSPCITSSQWHSALQKTGFAGVDAITPEVDVFPRPTFVIASQAVDERIKMLRQPLQASASEGSKQDLVVVGGTTLPTLRLADAVANLLRPWYSRVVRVTKLEDVDSSSSSPKSNVFCLTELDEPMFKSMTSEKLKGLQQLLGHTKVALWITRGSKEADPYSSMTTGFARSLTVEMPLLTLQLLDLGVDERPPAHVLAEIFLRLHIADIWDLDGSRDDILWSNEPELRMEEGQLLIPRLRPRKSANDRYNSSMRTITQEASTETSNIRLRHDISTYSLIEGTNLTQKVSGGHSIRIRVKYSYLSAIRLPSVGSYFIVFGSNVATGKEVFALSETQSSYVDVPEDLALSCAIPPGQEVQAVLRLASELLALRLTSYSSPNAIMLLHEPNKVLADILTQKASENLLAVAYTTSTLGSMPSPWIYIHPFASERSIMLALPPNPACFVDFSKRKDAGDVDLASRISGCLPRQCARYDINSVLSDDSQVLLESPEKASQLLRDAVSSLQSHPLSSEEPKPTKAVSVGDVPNSSTAFGSATVVCWESSSPTIPIKLEPVGSKISFDSNKTYVLFGLSSDLGQSLCQWMVEHGARYVVITSRNPTVDAAWSRRLEGMGASVKICSKFVNPL
jgi:hybrid polyketide synthase/nonribosomal peptide synthetase ACE1